MGGGGETVYSRNCQMTEDESECLSITFNTRATPTALVGGATERRQRVILCPNMSELFWKPLKNLSGRHV